jgi:hypothetical protein
MFAYAAFAFAPEGDCPPRAVRTAEAAYRWWVSGHVLGGVAVAALLVGLVLFLRRSRAGGGGLPQQ